MRLASEAMRGSPGLGRALWPFLPAGAGPGPDAEAPLPALLCAHVEVGVALTQPPGTVAAFAGAWAVGGVSLAEAEEWHAGPGPPWPGRPTVPLRVGTWLRVSPGVAWDGQCLAQESAGL